MSSLPGLSLESFLMWNYDLIVDDEPESNISLGLAEALGHVAPRPRLSMADFAPLVALFEVERENIEYLLAGFDPESQSWRDYAGGAFDYLPEPLLASARALLPAMVGRITP